MSIKEKEYLIETQPAIAEMMSDMLAKETEAMKTILETVVSLPYPSQTRVMTYALEFAAMLANENKKFINTLHPAMQKLLDEAIEQQKADIAADQ